MAQYADWTTESACTIGGYDLNTYAANSTVTWNPIFSDSYWTVKLSGASFSNSSFTPSVDYAVIDTGTSYISMPAVDL
jgi:hypothetical protein